jgi:prolyl 4-hydroxylase
VTHDSQTTQRDTAVRDSEVAVIPRTNDVRCIERRAMAAQGWRRDVWIERLRTQRYVAPAGHYSHHFDWNLAHRGGWGRVSSFMVWVDDGTLSGVAQSQGFEGGGTEFPRLEWRGEEQLCAFVECSEGGGKAEGGDESETKGLTFRVKPGNAVYWENFSPYDGHGYEETWHAGLPVTKGTKVGLNIWSYGRIE